MAAQNILAADVHVVQWDDVAEVAPHTSVILDVRDNAERQQGFIPGSIHSPLPQLRSRLGELPTDHEIIPYCHSGQRSYYACRLLSQHGFRMRNLTGSSRTWHAARRLSIQPTAGYSVSSFDTLSQARSARGKSL